MEDHAQLERIMYVDDEPDIRFVARAALAAEPGVELRGFQTAEEAIRDLVAFDPQIIMLDLMMPHMDGRQALAEIRKVDTRHLRAVVFVTAKSAPGLVDELMALGAVGVVQKPFDVSSLYRTLARLWRGVPGSAC